MRFRETNPAFQLDLIDQTRTTANWLSVGLLKQRLLPLLKAGDLRSRIRQNEKSECWLNLLSDLRLAQVYDFEIEARISAVH